MIGRVLRSERVFARPARRNGCLAFFFFIILNLRGFAAAVLVFIF